MTPASAAAERPEAPLFSDGLGERLVAVDAASGDLLQILRVRPQLLAVPSFEFALRERAARLANFRHAYYARVRRIDRHPGGLAIVSDHVEGVRLSDMLRVSEQRRLHLDLNAALCLLRQLVPSVALLHENARDVAHGLIAPERLIVTPRARLVVVEHVLGSAVEQLQFNRDRLWQELRVALPSSVGAPRFDHRADVTAIGLVALALVLGRPIREDEYPHKATALLNSARARSAGGEDQPLPESLHNWIARALQLDVRQGFLSATDAQIGLEEALADDTGFVAAPVALETFLSRYITALLEPVIPSAVPHPPAPIPEPVAVFEPPTPIVETPRVVVEPPKPVVQPVKPVAERPAAIVQPPNPVVAPPVAPKPELNSQPPQASTAVPAAEARDITELLRDFNLPASIEKQQPEAPGQQPPARQSVFASKRMIAIATGAVVVLAAGGFLGWRALRTTTPPVQMGSLSVQTNPPGAAVFVDGLEHGNTPARVSLKAGAHILELRGRGVPRSIPVTITAGADVSQYLELPQTPTVGSLLVQSEPSGAQVFVDGVEHGKAPASVGDLTPGEHEVELRVQGATPVKQRVVIEAGVTASVLTPIATAAPGPVSGWLSLKAPVTIDVRENGKLLGTSDSDRIMLAAGRHDLELSNDTLGFHATRAVVVTAGKVAPVAVDMPQGVINVNASPWAEVFIDGKKVGETPIGNLAVSIGPHELVFRHPQLGEKRQAVSVTLNAPVRVSVDMK
ncbi:MAG TPA: PEGA domain-containing protein [Vicinamibacterales bacterium]|jgi:serine/threonine protein kinase|nr:PEGA domain-containing protein [Vicinamibacterales bacterium]